MAEHPPVLEEAPPPGPRRRLRWPDVPVRRPWEGPLWMIAGFAAALLMTWPLARQLRTAVPNSTEDPLAQAWGIAWGGHALRTQPSSLFDANVFWPSTPSLAFSDSMLGYAPFALFGSGPTDALVRYNVVFLFAYALVFAAAGLLSRELGLRLPAAVVVAVAAAFSPTRTMQNNHLNILSVGGIVLTVFLLVSGYRRQRRWQIVAGWSAAAWQMTIGFAMGIWFFYLLALLAAAVLVGWLVLQRPPVLRRLIAPTVAGVVILGGTTVLMLLPYLQVIDQYPQAGQRERFELDFFAPPPRGAFAASAESVVWGPRTEPVRATLNWPTEQTLFPGLTVLVLAAAGLRWGALSRSVRAGLLFVGSFTFLLSFGPRFEGGLLYEPFYDFLPGWGNIRTPGRLAFVWSLALALLAGMGVQRLLERLGASAPGRHLQASRSRTLAGGGLALALAGLVAYEGAIRIPLQPVLAPPVAFSSLAAPQLHLPSDFARDGYYMFWSTDGFPEIANGSSSFGPPEVEELRRLTSFPDAGSIAVLRERGVRTVVVHRRTVAGTPFDGAAERPVGDPGVVRRDLGEVVVFELGT